MTDLELAFQIERVPYRCFTPDEIRQIIAALRRGPERPPSGEMVMALECAEYALSHPASDQIFALNAVRAALSAAEAEGRKG